MYVMTDDFIHVKLPYSNEFCFTFQTDKNSTIIFGISICSMSELYLLKFINFLRKNVSKISG